MAVVVAIPDSCNLGHKAEEDVRKIRQQKCRTSFTFCPLRRCPAKDADEKPAQWLSGSDQAPNRHYAMVQANEAKPQSEVSHSNLRSCRRAAAHARISSSISRLPCTEDTEDKTYIFYDCHLTNIAN